LIASEEKRDKHFPLFAHDNPIRKLFDPPQRLVEPYVANGQVVADLGCDPGFHTLALAELVGPEGKVYAVDSDEKAIRAVERKATRRGYQNIQAHASSASDLGFIKDESVDFVLANGLLCSMSPQQRESAVNEIRRILKPTGRAYLSAARGHWSYVNQAEWERILANFRVERRGGDGFLATSDRWAVVSKNKLAEREMTVGAQI
jgi:ubiquinone/menaquinone biosynthesis C-methylase UbiE